jgi:hypothetical protein
MLAVGNISFYISCQDLSDIFVCWKQFVPVGANPKYTTLNRMLLLSSHDVRGMFSMKSYSLPRSSLHTLTITYAGGMSDKISPDWSKHWPCSVANICLCFAFYAQLDKNGGKNAVRFHQLLSPLASIDRHDEITLQPPMFFKKKRCNQK